MAAGALVAVGPAPAAATDPVVDRTWTGRYRTMATARMEAFVDGTGRLSISLRQSGANRSWRPRISRGTCASVGARIANLRWIRTDTTGSVDATVNMSSHVTGLVWQSTWRHGTFALRLQSGAAVRCMTFSFPRATRVVVSGMRIDLPVVRGGSAVLCNVAMYLGHASQPREPGVTFIYAHARKGMFLPLLNASRRKNGASMIGRTVYVYTSENLRYEYRITRVRRHQRSIQRALEIPSRQLWLQTSEGPYASSTKLIVIAAPVGSPVAVSAARARPKPHPVSCR